MVFRFDNKKHGFYSYVQFQFHQYWIMGARFDYYAELEAHAGSGRTIDRENFAQSAWITFRPSEFSYFRLSGERRDLFGRMNDDYAAYIQADFILGHHPAHRY